MRIAAAGATVIDERNIDPARTDVLAATPPWMVHVSTVGMTVIRLVSRRSEGGEGWPLPRLLSELSALGVTREGAPRAVGSGAGAPLIHSAELRWQGCALHAEARVLEDAGVTELTLELPSWDELSEAVAHEDELWSLVDVAASCAEAEHGCLGDGEALEPQPPLDPHELMLRCARHPGVLVSERMGDAVSPRIAMPYRALYRSGLVVLLH
ncbi:MAG TPA: hypothetical protein VJU79_10595 [Candidatus Dormibacteraeota bacterium]|nr:hypothetical protein [Candidatus Dormibacteraeota bacterium]